MDCINGVAELPYGPIIYFICRYLFNQMFKALAVFIFY